MMESHTGSSQCASGKTAQLLLPDLPDPCLLAVMQHCTSDLPSLFSAARTHSKLHHQADIMALSSITWQVSTQQHLDSIMQYLKQHGRHVSSISLAGPEYRKGQFIHPEKQPGVILGELPNNLPPPASSWVVCQYSCSQAMVTRAY